MRNRVPRGLHALLLPLVLQAKNLVQLSPRQSARSHFGAPLMAFVEAEAPRVSCGKHGVVVARVPWARHDSRFTKDFEDQCAWLAVHVSKTTLQSAKLADIARIKKPLYRAYLLKEQLREVFRLPFRAAVALLDHWLAWARRSRLPPFVRLARSIRDHQATTVTTLRFGLSNARVEAVNTRIRLPTRIAFGLHSATPLIGMVLLALGGLCPPLPGRS